MTPYRVLAMAVPFFVVVVFFSVAVQLLADKVTGYEIPTGPYWPLLEPHLLGSWLAGFGTAFLGWFFAEHV